MEKESDKERTVERNFLLPKNFRENVIEQGGKVMKENKFLDTYYDTSDFKLTLANYWLKSRADVFELKFPTGGADSDYANQYQETKDEGTIIKQLCHLLELKKEKVSSIKELATQDLETFASIETLRKIYELDGCKISADIADFGLDLGVISVPQGKDETLMQATNKINGLAKKLGCTSFADLDMNSLVQENLPQLSLDDSVLDNEASGGDGAVGDSAKLAKDVDNQD